MTPVPEAAAQPGTLGVRAPAKINLFLAVGPLRPDGYHELLTLFEAVPLEDILTIKVRPAFDQSLSIRVRTRLRTAGRGRRRGEDLPKGIDNLAGRAARLYADAVSARGERALVARIEIHIEKHIPVAAGLGGGSSDAAAVLRAFQNHFGRVLDETSLLQTAAALGSDVPFFLSPGRAVGRSRGEDLTPVPAARGLPLVLGLPSFGLRTSEVYRRFDRVAVPPEAPLPPPAGGLDDLLAALTRGTLADIAVFLRNDLQPAALALRPEIDVVLRALREAGCLNALVSGSGPSVFGLAPRIEEAEGIADRAHRLLPPAMKSGVVFRPVMSAPAWSGGPEP